MIRTLPKNNPEYKDFFNITSYLPEDFEEVSYRKTKVSSEKLPKERSEQSIVSFEKIRVDNMLGVYKYLEYKLPKMEQELLRGNREKLSDTEKRKIQSRLEWFEKNVRFFKQKLSQIEDSTTFITPKFAFFCKHFEKIKYQNDHKVVGRLYNNKSIQTLPREIRYHLFKDDYKDFDMVNSHPSILYEFSKEHNLKLNGSLERYVKNRSSVFEQIKQEQLKNNIEVLNNGEIKTEILKGLNREWLPEKEIANTLIDLHYDFESIRNHLCYLYESGQLDKEYRHAIEHSKEKGSSSLKVSLQSFYCQTQESFHIIRLVEFLRKKYLEILKVEGKQYFTDYYPNTDKKVELSAIHTLFIVPFFDGVYISSPERAFNTKLLSFVEEFNKSEKGSSIAFEEKQIKQRVKQIVDVDELSAFLVIHRWLTRKKLLDII